MTDILIIDDDKMFCRSLQLQLETHGFKSTTRHTGEDGFKSLLEENPTIVFLDYHLPDITGLDFLKKAKERKIKNPIVLVTGREDMDIVIEAMKLNAFDYLRKPIELEDILILIEKAKLKEREKKEVVESVEKTSTNEYAIIGKSKGITETLKQIGLVSVNRVPVLIVGESGTGKELVARAIHRAMDPSKPFVPINASAIPSTLIEAELFGAEKGSYTGADRTRIGKLEQAGDGVVFLDEISEIPSEFQVKLLRVLQEKEFERIGGHKRIPLKARIIAASNKDLKKLVKEGKFREDLYYRLSVAEIHIPPLRERIEDIPVLVNYFLNKHKNLRLYPIKGITSRALKLLESYNFPGNVRQLENIIIRAIINCKIDYIDESDIRKELNVSATIPEKIMPLKEVEKNYIKFVLNYTDWNITRTSKILEIAPNTLRKKIADYNLKKQMK